MKWIELPPEHQKHVIDFIKDKAQYNRERIGANEKSAAFATQLDAAAAFLQTSTEEPFAEQIRTDMAVLQRLFEAWKAAPSEETWRAALSACVPLHYMIRSTHPDRKTFEAIRAVLTESRPK